VNVLGFDTSTAATAVCVERADGEAFELVPDPARLGARPAHAGELLPAAAHLLAEAGLDWTELDAVAVGVGPGTFTGLRIGVASARSLALARGLELRPVSSLAALAEGIEGPLRLPAIDARRGELFAALYEGGEQRLPAAAWVPAELADALREEGGAPRAAGDGAIHFRQVLEAAGARVEPDGARVHVVRALHVCRLARRVPARPPDTVLPHYLRLPDAQPT
jgi:tRNA threonylcarbamoyladenosine biosynthesis protein TsaB